MRKSIEKSKEKAIKKIKSVDKQREDLKTVLPKGKSGLPIVTIQVGEISTSIEIPFKPIMDLFNKMEMNNRTVAEIFGVKIGIDVI